MVLCAVCSGNAFITLDMGLAGRDWFCFTCGSYFLSREAEKHLSVCSLTLEDQGVLSQEVARLSSQRAAGFSLFMMVSTLQRLGLPSSQTP